MAEPKPPAAAAPAPAASRLPYEPPRIEEIELVAGEAMLGFCKTTQGGFGGVPSICGSTCSGFGS